MIRLKKGDPRPLYLQIKGDLEAKIAAGSFAPDQALPNERELAEELGLSRMTVRRAMVELTNDGLLERIPGRGTFVRAREVKVIAPGNLIPSAQNAIALVLPHGRIDTRGSLFYYRVIQGMQDACPPGSSISLRHGDDAGPLIAALKADPTVRGLVVLGIIDAVRVRQFVEESGLPTVLYDCAAPESNTPFDIVTHASDNGGYLATSALLELGHRDIAFFVHASSNDAKNAIVGSIARERQAGFERAFREHGLNVPKGRVQPVIPCSESGYTVARRVLSASKRKRPTAIFCSIDETAIGVIAAAKDLGLKIPQDLSVVGFGDIGQFVTPALSAVRLEMELSGREAVKLLGERIDNPSLASRKCVLPAEFISRASSGAPYFS